MMHTHFSLLTRKHEMGTIICSEYISSFHPTRCTRISALADFRWRIGRFSRKISKWEFFFVWRSLSLAASAAASPSKLFKYVRKYARTWGFRHGCRSANCHHHQHTHSLSLAASTTLTAFANLLNFQILRLMLILFWFTSMWHRTKCLVEKWTSPVVEVRIHHHHISALVGLQWGWHKVTKAWCSQRIDNKSICVNNSTYFMKAKHIFQAAFGLSPSHSPS